MDVVEAIEAYRVAIVDHTRAFDRWDATVPGSVEASKREAELRAAVKTVDGAYGALIDLLPEAELDFELFPDGRIVIS